MWLQNSKFKPPWAAPRGKKPHHLLQHRAAYLMGIHWRLFNKIYVKPSTQNPFPFYTRRKQALKNLIRTKYLSIQWNKSSHIKWNTKYYVFSNSYSLEYNSLITKSKINGSKSSDLNLFLYQNIKILKILAAINLLFLLNSKYSRT